MKACQNPRHNPRVFDLASISPKRCHPGSLHSLCKSVYEMREVKIGISHFPCLNCSEFQIRASSEWLKDFSFIASLLTDVSVICGTLLVLLDLRKALKTNTEKFDIEFHCLHTCVQFSKYQKYKSSLGKKLNIILKSNIQDKILKHYPNGLIRYLTQYIKNVNDGHRMQDLGNIQYNVLILKINVKLHPQIENGAKPI